MKQPLFPGAKGSGQRVALTLGTGAFAVTFALWGLLSGLLPILKETLELSASQASLLVALPVVVGSLGRIPIGLLADRIGGKRLLISLLFLSSAAAALVGLALNSGWNLIPFALALGIGGTSFVVGITFVSRWFPPEQQGTALGFYGFGNVGHSIAVFGAPLMAHWFGAPWAVYAFAAAALLYCLIFAVRAEDATWKRPPVPVSTVARLIFLPGQCWVLCLFYFLTFGGFVTLSIYLPMLLKDLFDLTPSDAGFRTAIFVLAATAARPVGGWLSDRFGGEKVLYLVFAALIPCGFLLSVNDLGYFTLGATAAAVLVGLGNGGVFKLVPHFYPDQVGTVSGIVGAAGGIGGFFPPLLLGFVRDQTGYYGPGFYGLMLFSLFCLVVLHLAVARRKTE